MRNSAAVWVTRKLRVVKKATTATLTVTADDLAKSLGNLTTTNSQVRVYGASTWNVTNSSDTTNYVSMTLDGRTSFSVDALGPFEDYGAGGSPPGVRVDLPNSLSKPFVVASSAADTVLTVSVDPLATAPVSTQTVVVDLYVSVQM